MSDKTKIEWSEATWNPVVGCSIVSPGCTNCYAMKQAHRISHMSNDLSHYFGTTKVVNGNAVWTGELKQAPGHILLQPLKWKRPRKIFVNSMSDLFHEDIPDDAIDCVFAIMALSPQHIFQVLTKRSARMRAYFESKEYQTRRSFINNACFRVNRVSGEKFTDDQCNIRSYRWPLPNVWLGVSCEDAAHRCRIDDLRQTPAAMRFVSFEPLLSPMGNVDLSEIGWAIVGGESGPGFRPMQIEWAESIREQCKAAGTAFFFKQDSGPRSGLRGNASDALWSYKQFPEVK